MRRLTPYPFNGLYYYLRSHLGTFEVRHAEFDSASGFIAGCYLVSNMRNEVPDDSTK
jgi:hypothetical protein